MSPLLIVVSTHQNRIPFQKVFVADTDHGRARTGVTRGPEVRLNWSSDKRLEVHYHQFARVIRSEEKARGVEIRYAMFE